MWGVGAQGSDWAWRDLTLQLIGMETCVPCWMMTLTCEPRILKRVSMWSDILITKTLTRIFQNNFLLLIDLLNKTHETRQQHCHPILWDKETKLKELNMSRIIDCGGQSKTCALIFQLLVRSSVPSSKPVFDSKRSASPGTLTRSWKCRDRYPLSSRWDLLPLPHLCAHSPQRA